MGKPLSSIVGLGFSQFSREDIGSTRDLAIAAIEAAVRDAGLDADDLDGLLITRSSSAPAHDLPLNIRNDLGFKALRLLSIVDAEGASAVQAIQHATLALQNDMASAVVCVFADARVDSSASGAAFSRIMSLTGITDWERQYGLYGAIGPYALAARRYMARYGATQADFGAYAIACRKWARKNPSAFLRKPFSMEDYLASRWVVEPLRMLDCAYAVNGAIAVVLTTCERAMDFPRPPVYVHGMGQGHSRLTGLPALDEKSGSGAAGAAAQAYSMAGIGPGDIDMCQLYDAFSYLGLQLLEDYGLCKPGEAGAFVAEGHTSPGGRLPVNTGGGHLSGFYLQGMTPVSEAVIQARGAGAERQAGHCNAILVNGNGGQSDYHAALILSPHRSLT